MPQPTRYITFFLICTILVTGASLWVGCSNTSDAELRKAKEEAAAATAELAKARDEAELIKAREEERQRADAKLTSMLVGNWVSDTFYQPGYKIGDNMSRQLMNWTFNRDGTFAVYNSTNSSVAGSIIDNVFGGTTKGKWYIHDQQLITEITGAYNPFANALDVGKPHRHASGEVKVDNKDQFWIKDQFYEKDVPFYRKK